MATVASDGADNAALLAIQILALSDEALSAKLLEMKEEMAEGVREKDAKKMCIRDRSGYRQDRKCGGEL